MHHRWLKGLAASKRALHVAKSALRVPLPRLPARASFDYRDSHTSRPGARKILTWPAWVHTHTHTHTHTHSHPRAPTTLLAGAPPGRPPDATRVPVRRPQTTPHSSPHSKTRPRKRAFLGHPHSRACMRAVTRHSLGGCSTRPPHTRPLATIPGTLPRSPTLMHGSTHTTVATSASSAGMLAAAAGPALRWAIILLSAATYARVDDTTMSLSAPCPANVRCTIWSCALVLYPCSETLPAARICTCRNQRGVRPSQPAPPRPPTRRRRHPPMAAPLPADAAQRSGVCWGRARTA